MTEKLDHAVAVTLAVMAWVASRTASALLMFVFCFAVFAGAYCAVAGIINFAIVFTGA